MDKIFLNAAFSLLSGVFTIFLLSFTGFLFNLSITPLYAVFGLLITFLAFIFGLWNLKIPPKKNATLCVLLFLLIAVIVLISAHFMDFSYDGRGYHQVTTLLLNDGWNPVYTDVYDFASKQYGFRPEGLIWSENYVKFSEIFAANILSSTDKIEAGKAFNGLACLIAFFYSFYTLKRISCITPQDRGFRKYAPLIFSFILVYNPVVITQFFTYYIDGLLYLYFLIAVFSLANWNIELYDGKKPYTSILFFVMSSVIAVNIKLGGLLCFACVLLCAILFLIFQKTAYLLKKTDTERVYAKSVFNTKAFWCSVLMVVILGLLSGTNPYFTNISKGKNALYPLAGKNKLDIITPNSPKAFENKPAYYKFFISLFSQTDNFAYNSDKNPRLKIPFTVQKSELLPAKDPDVRVAGFGPFFSGIFLLSLLLFFTAKPYRTVHFKKEFSIIFALLLFSILLNPESWWARYVPQLWAVIALMSFFAYLTSKNRKNVCLVWVLAILMLLNSFLINCANYARAKRYAEQTTLVINSIKALQKTDGTAVVQKIPEPKPLAFSYLRKLDEAGVKYDMARILR